MIKHDYTDKNYAGSSGNRMHYDARRVESEKNTMRMLDEKRGSEAYSRDVIPFDTTTDMIAFQPKNRIPAEEDTDESRTYPKSDVARNIDEAERYINFIATQNSLTDASPAVEKTQKPLPSTMEISVFEPKMNFTGEVQAETRGAGGSNPMSGDTSMTRAYRVGGGATEQTRAFRTIGDAPEQTRAFRTIGDAPEQTRAFRTRGDAPEQTRAFRTIGDAPEQTRAFHTIGDAPEQTRAYHTIGDAPEQTRAFRAAGAPEQTTVFSRNGAPMEQTRAFRAGGAKTEQTRAFGVNANAAARNPHAERIAMLMDEAANADEKMKTTETSKSKKVRKEKEPVVRYEYTSPMQNEKIESDMKSSFKKVKLRLAISVLLAIVLFLIENIAPIKALFPTRFAYITVDWVLAFVCMFLIVDRLGNAFKSFFSRTPEVDCITVLAFIFSVAATAVALIFESTETVITLYNFPLAVCVFLNLLFVYYRLRRDIYSFAILSSSGDKRAVVLENSEEESLSEAEQSIIPESSEPVKFGSIKRVNFIDGYFRHGAEVPNAQRSLKIFIPFCLAVSVAFFCCSLWLMGYTVPESLGVAYATFMICAPGSVFLDYCYPLYLAARRAKNYNSAILCDKTPDVYRDFSMVVFRDTEAIPSGKAKVKSIRLYGDKKIDNAIYYASSIYSAVGGPLAEVFRSAALNSVSSENVQIREISDEGACAMVDGKHIVIGRPSYMEEQCFETMYEAGDDEYDGKTNKRIIYLACDQFIIAKFYIQYSVGADFLNITDRLFSAGLGISVRTADPCLDDGIFYENKIDPEQHAIRISRSCPEGKEEKSIPASRAGIVSVGDVKDLIKALLLCRRLENVRRTKLLLNVVSSVFAVAVMALVLFTGNAVGMHSVYPALYQLFWILPTYFVSKVYL